MTLLVLLIFCATNIIVETIYVPGSIGKIDIKTLLKRDSVTPVNTTSKESYLSIKQLAKKHGYVIEEYKVTTEDGYILGLHRLSKGDRNDSGVPVFLMHGLLDSSDSWILQGSNSALGYLLTEKGFDVWLGNARGNKHCSGHTELSPNEESFWKFSWEEIGVYDLPAMINYVLTATDKKSLYYVGHSQGTTSFFVMNSLKPEYRSKIKMMFALSPIAWLSHADSPMLKYLSRVPVTLLQYFQLNTLTMSSDVLYDTYSSMCKVISTGCGNVFQMLFGINHYVSAAMLPIIVEHASTSSVLQFVHFWQLYQSGRFCRFDYGWMRNLFIYGGFSPPDYELSDVTVPVVTFFSGNDLLSHPLDVSILHSHLPNVFKSYYSQDFSHIDYMYASVAKDIVYEKIITHILDYERQLHHNINDVNVSLFS